MLIKFFTCFLFTNFGSICAELDHIVDLTWDFSNESIYWPGTRPFSWTKRVADSSPGYWFAENEFCTAEHLGTHLDAPFHFNEQGWKVSDIPLNRLITTGAFIDLSHNHTEALSEQHLEKWVQQNGNFENNTMLLIKFGWSKFWGNRTIYLGLDNDGNMNFPGISREAATWIVNSGKVVGVGLDTSSVDPGSSTDMMTHRILYKNQIYGVESVKLLVDLPAKGFTLIVLPMKLKDGSGGPTRILAVRKGFF